jgi:putative intracellular protease/amidase
MFISHLLVSNCYANSDEALIKETLDNYFTGTGYSDKNKLHDAFHDSAILYLEKADMPLWEVSAKEYTDWHKDSNKGRFNGRTGNVLNIDIAGSIATAKAEILIPGKNARFIDMFLLKKLSGQWQIISKSAIADTTDRQPTNKRILFITSSAHFHGDTDLATGVSFSEIVNAYHVFKEAGYNVDFVSPEGGAIPLSYINTSAPLHKKYLYDRDFMYAIGHTATPEQVDASLYVAVHYVGGGNAMYGVADNTAIQAIAMQVYEKQNGIISSVCHGTAGIVNLRKQDGSYLVNGARISGYPEAYENQSGEHFKQFPFLIQQTIEARGGQFFYSERNTPHIEVDGRIVTGQNYLSSAGVAKRMIELIENAG